MKAMSENFIAQGCMK
ncbi:hypothetical protein BLA29_014341 [Euroglyphus maynei]|uniref:Uncharacterized protein n=1 Tax=Euroglyphus maynei TaxID=6958 RepID=A0A1Y3AV22_EURMA|nr:hypothetical protein BLA29_014341 [Euroglyphus maynei]